MFNYELDQVCNCIELGERELQRSQSWADK
jgi:hypothetical protein